MRLGEVWNVDLPYSDGREQTGRRPAVVVQDEPRDGLASPLITVVPLSSRLASARFGSTFVIAPDGPNGLSFRSVAMIFQIRSLDRIRFFGRLGSLSDTDLAAVRAEIRLHFGL